MRFKMASGEDFTIDTKGGYTLTAPDKTGTLATVGDIPADKVEIIELENTEIGASTTSLPSGTYDAIYAATPSGKTVVLNAYSDHGGAQQFYLSYCPDYNDDFVTLSTVPDECGVYCSIQLNPDDTCSVSLHHLEDESNKVTSLSSSSTDTQYPSAKCVYDAIQAGGGGGGGESPVSVITTENGDFELQDEDGNVLVRCENGHIKTKNFDSSDFSATEKRSLKILFFGNSLTQDAVAYLPLLLKEITPEIDFEIYLWYNGGINLTTQYSTYLQNPTTNCGIFSIFKSSDNKWTNYTNSKSINWVVANCDFDILCLQEYGNNGQSDSQIITAFDNISDWFATYYDKPLKVVSLMDAPARIDVSGVTTRIEHYNQVFYQNCPSEGIIPAGLAMSYACQDTTLNQLGDSGGLSPDGVHAQEGLPCLLQSYVVAMWLFREMGITKSIWGSKLRITTDIYTALDVPGANLGTGVITGTEAENILAQRCAIKAIKRGRELEVLTVNS